MALAGSSCARANPASARPGSPRSSPGWRSRAAWLLPGDVWRWRALRSSGHGVRCSARSASIPPAWTRATSGTADDGTLRVISLWESKAHADRFFTEKLGPALAKVLGPEPVGAPTAVGIDVARTYARQPVG